MTIHNRLCDADRAELMQHWRAGKTASWAADLVGCAIHTAERYFLRFAAEGIYRGPMQRKPRRKRDRLPVYDGPDWIGVSADIR